MTFQQKRFRNGNRYMQQSCLIGTHAAFFSLTIASVWYYIY